MVVLVDMIDSITQFNTHQAIPTQILTKCIVLVVEKLVSGGKAPLSPRIQIGWDTYLVKMLYLHDQI